MPATPEQLVSRFRDKPLDFSPGEKWSYSNSGYVLLGCLIEKMSGHSYAQFVQDNFFSPLGMKDSGYDDSNSAIVGRRASGYEPGTDGPTKAGLVLISFSAGSLFHDGGPAALGKGLFGGKVLSEASLRKMTAPFKNDYAFGLGVSTLKGQRRSRTAKVDSGLPRVASLIPGGQIDRRGSEENWLIQYPMRLRASWGALARDKSGTAIGRGESLSRDVLSRYTGTYDFGPGVNVLDGNEGVSYP